MIDVGETTRDLIELHKPHPAEQGIDDGAREAAIRRTGNRFLGWGLGIAAGSYILSLSIAIIIAGKPVIEDHSAVRLFLLLGLIAVIGVAVTAISLGGTERLDRHQRAATRQARMELTDVRNELARIGSALDMIATHMPEHDQIVNWRGFNHAVREGFAESTGTDGSTGRQVRGRSARLGLVHPDRD